MIIGKRQETSAIGYRLSDIRHRISAISCQTSVAGYRNLVGASRSWPEASILYFVLCIMGTMHFSA